MDADNFAVLTDMLKGNKGEMGISLRLLDYFACTYSRVRNIQYAVPDKALPFMVYDSYTQQLRSVSTLFLFRFLSTVIWILVLARLAEVHCKQS
jgi:hypothetical protein